MAYKPKFADVPAPPIEMVTTPEMIRESAALIRAFHKHLDQRGAINPLLDCAFPGGDRSARGKKHHWYQWFRNYTDEEIGALDELQIRLFCSHRLTFAGVMAFNRLIHSYMPHMSPIIFDKVADAMEAGCTNPGEILLEACGFQARQLGFRGCQWREAVSGIFDLAVAICHRTPTEFVGCPPAEHEIRYLSVFEGIFGKSSIRYSSTKSFDGLHSQTLRTHAKELWEDHSRYTQRGRTNLKEQEHRLERIYHHMSPELFHALMRSPRYIGLPRKHLETALAYCGEEGLQLVLVFGRSWKSYYDKHSEKTLRKTVPFSALKDADISEEDYKLSMRTAQAHRLTQILPQTVGYQGVKGLGEYLMRHNYVRNKPWIDSVARSWPFLTDDEKSMDPRSAFDHMCDRRYGHLLSQIEMIPKELLEETQKWMPNLMAEADKDCETHEEALQRMIDITAIYTSSLNVPLPEWATGTFVSGPLRGCFLPRNDPRGLFIGYYTECCQHMGTSLGASECAVHAQRSPYGCNFVIIKHESIVANAWVFEGKDGRIVLDNVENIKVMDFDTDIKSIVEQLAHSIEDRMVTVGKSYTKIDFTKHKTLEEPKELKIEDSPWWPREYDGKYTDARIQILLSDNRSGIMSRVKGLSSGVIAP